MTVSKRDTIAVQLPPGSNNETSEDLQMSRVVRTAFVFWMVVASIAGIVAWQAFGQEPMKPVNDLPNPYQTVENFLKLPEGRAWGSTSSVAIDKDGKSIWAMERCGVNSCVTDAT